MAMNMDDGGYLGAYKRFFIDFVERMNPEDQLPVKVTGHDVIEDELVGEIIDMTLQYLNPKDCPPSLQSYLIHVVIKEMLAMHRCQPLSCGLKLQDHTYAPLKLMQAVTGKVNEICKRYLENSRLALLPPPPTMPLPIVTVSAIRNSRRKMEDRHVILHDLNTIFNIKDEYASYYGVFDGHAGQDAAIYCAAHLHQYLCESVYYPTDMERALRDAFVTTDAYFIQKSQRYNLTSGATAVCAVIFKRKLYVAWAGDSQVALVKQGNVNQLVNRHRPDRSDEKERVLKMGGSVLHFGMLRVDGHLAVTRAIGDAQYKPYVTADPEIRCVMLDGTEDFLIVACDGVWDYISEQAAAMVVYKQVYRDPYNYEAVSQRLVDYTKNQGSTDNITAIVVFLTPPSQIAARSPNDNPLLADVYLDIMDDDNRYLSNANGEYEVQTSFVKQAQNRSNGSNFSDETTPFVYEKSSNGKHENGTVGYNDIDDDDDLGPETDVDAVDDSGEINTLANVSRELFPDKESNDDFNADNIVNDDATVTPTVTKLQQNELIAESENVGDSEDSDDEWNYYKVDPNKEKDTDDSVKPEFKVQSNDIDDKLIDNDTLKLEQVENIISEKEQQQQLEDNEIDSCSDSGAESEREVCSNELIDTEISKEKIEEPVIPQVTADNLEDMDSQLNPNAAEFIPVSPIIPSRLLDQPIAGSPLKQTPIMDDIRLPSPKEFTEEANHRPHDVDDKDDIINSSNGNLLTGNDGNEFFDHQKLIFNLDESEISSTRAEFGDESTASFLTTADYPKNEGLDGSFTDSCTGAYDNESMMMSFGPGTFNPLSNPVDLNAVHDLSDTDLCDPDDQTLPVELEQVEWEKDLKQQENDEKHEVHSSDVHPELVNLISSESDQLPSSVVFPDHQGNDLLNTSSPVPDDNSNVDKFHDEIENVTSEVAAMNLKNEKLSEVHDENKMSTLALSEINDEIEKAVSSHNQLSNVDDLFLSTPQSSATAVEIDNNLLPRSQSNSSLRCSSEEDIEISPPAFQNDQLQDKSIEISTPKFEEIQQQHEPVEISISKFEEIQQEHEPVEISSPKFEEIQQQHEPIDIPSSKFEENHQEYEPIEISIPKFQENIEQQYDTMEISSPKFSEDELIEQCEPIDNSSSKFDLENQQCENIKLFNPTIDENQQEYETMEISSSKHEENQHHEYDNLISNDVLKSSPIESVNKEDKLEILEECQKTASHENIFENPLDSNSILHPETEASPYETLDDPAEEVIITFEDDDGPICPTFDPPTGDPFARALSPARDEHEIPKDIVEECKSPVEQSHAADTDTALKLSESLQEFTGLENELTPLTNGDASKAEIQAPEATITESIIDEISQISKVEDTTTMPLVTEEIVKSTVPSQQTTINPSIVAATTAVVAGAVASAAVAAKSKTATKSPQKTATKTATTKSTNKLSPTSPNKSLSSTPSRPVSSVNTKKTPTSTAARSKPAEVVPKSSPTANKLSAVKSTAKPTARMSTTTKPKATTLKSTPATIERKSAGSITSNGEIKSTTAKPAPKPKTTTATGVTSKPQVKSTATSVRSTTALTAKSKPPTTGSTATTKVSARPSTGVTSTVGATARPKTAPATLGVIKNRVQSTTKSPTIDKQIKETANKQISSSRTSTTTTTRVSRTSNASATTTVTSTTNGTRRTNPLPAKKNSPTTRMSAKSATAISKTNTKNCTVKTKMQNGVCEIKETKVITEATTTMTATNDQDLLQKDSSPVELTTDNQLLITAD